MKLTKRILALVLVFCTVAAWMIPGVSAADAEAVTYYFDSTPAEGVTFQTGSSSGATCYWFHLASYVNWTTAETAFGEGKLNWKFQANSSSSARQYADYLHNYTGASYDKQDRNQIAIEIKEPAAGTYKLNVNYLTSTSGFDNVRVYIVEAPAEPFTRFSNWSNTGTLYPFMSSYRAANASLNTFSTWGTEKAAASANGTVEFEIVEGKEYVVVFDPINVDQDVASGNANFYLQSFTLNPVVKTDYTVTYHANYEGADPATVADSDNVTGSTDSQKDFTVDAVPFAHPGSFAFQGWATAPGGEVAYQPGDTITLTPDSATADLYAIWKEVWDPENNDDMTIVFKDVSTAAGVTGNTFWSAGYPGKTDAVYAQTGWTATTIYNTYPPRYFNTGGIQFYTEKAGTYYAATKFVAPGTGDYKLTLDTCIVSSADARAEKAGAYIIPYGSYSAATLPAYTSIDNAIVLTQEQLAKTTAYPAENTVALEGGAEYMLVFFVYASANTLKGKADFKGFSLTEVKPEASIGSTNYATVEEAIEKAVFGDTIKLNVNADILNLNLGENITLNLNGKTLTVSGVVAAGNAFITDTSNSEGLLAAANNGVLKAPAGQVALWDNTKGSEGYRVFNYTFETYGNGVYEGSNAAVTGVNTEFAFYDYVRNYVANVFAADGEVAQSFGDTAWTMVNPKSANGKNVGQTMKDDYEAGNVDWRFEYCTSSYQMGKGAQGFSWGYKAMKQFGAGYTAIRFRSPGAGEIKVSVLGDLYQSNPADTAAFDLYIVKASAVENAIADYDTVSDTYLATPATLISEYTTAMQNAYSATEPVISAVCDDNTYTGSYEFEADCEYIAIFNITSGSRMQISSLSFNRAAKAEGMVQTFWSTLQFSNAKAYTLIPASGLEAGFDMTWEGEGFTAPAPRNFKLDSSIIEEWAETQAGDLANVYGFYVRVSGFEAAGAGTLTGTPYIVLNGEKIPASTTTYTYTAE